jgi:hypothetical protein
MYIRMYVRAAPSAEGPRAGCLELSWRTLRVQSDVPLRRAASQQTGEQQAVRRARSAPKEEPSPVDAREPSYAEGRVGSAAY